MPTICLSMCPAEESPWRGLSIGPGVPGPSCSWECTDRSHEECIVLFVLSCARVRRCALVSVASVVFIVKLKELQCVVVC